MANKDVGVRFLIWTYFNLDGSETKDEIVNRCIDLAYKDATNQGAFNAVQNKGVFDTKAAAKHFRVKILNGPAKPFDAWHKEMCGDLVDYYSVGKEKDPPAFSYGNAQKWLNMTIKYLYIYRALTDALSNLTQGQNEYRAFYDDLYLRFEHNFHIPIDSFIMEAIWPQNLPSSNWIPGANLPQKGPGIYSGTKHTPWSQFDDIAYNSVQNYIRGQLDGRSPMEWENEHWITIAKHRKDEADKSK